MNGWIAVAMAEGGAKMKRLAFDLPQHCDGGVTIAIQGGDDGPLGFNSRTGERVVELRQNFQSVSVPLPALKG
jgi:hypothetical protein